MEKKVKETRKTHIAIDKLHGLVKHMEYYYKGTEQWKYFLKDASYIEEYILEISIDKKVDHARFAQKLKKIFFKENKELKEEIKELKEEIQELKDDR
jgi:hypothetical protein